MPIVYGSQYYRPPEPAPDEWQQDLARMRETGLRVVKLWAMWGWMEPAEGQYRFEEFDRLFDLAHQCGLLVLPNLILECAPWWAQDRFPDGLWTSSRWVSASTANSLQHAGGRMAGSVSQPSGRAPRGGRIHAGGR